MGKLVTINLIGGDFEQGFFIFLQIRTEDNSQWIAAAKGKLPPAKELLENYKSWQSKYRKHVSGRNSVRMSVTGATDTTIISDIKKASQQLKSSLNNWLKGDYEFSPIREKLFQNLKDETEEIRVIFDIDNQELERLPWHLWDDFFKYYYRAEVALSLPIKQIPRVTRANSRIKVFAVFGRDTRINLYQDWEMLKQKLAQHSNAELIHVEKPSLEHLCEQIEEHKPQILFFAGHSRSEESGDNGFIDLNDEETITIDNLEPELSKAVKWGLQLAIFNSCDGLGIARKLAQLGLPNIIVMREPVPDEVAQKFLQRFLEVFALGKPLHLAVRRARERINRLENKFPGATWLPTIFQNPAEPPLTWQSLGGVEIQQPSNHNSVINVDSQTENYSQIPWLPTYITDVEKSTTTCRNGHENSANNRFCIHCGIALTSLLICSKGHENDPNHKFCSSCGESLQRIFTGIDSIGDSTSIQPEPAPTSISTKTNFSSSNEIGNLLSGRYKIIQQIGRGGVGITFLAEDILRPGNPQCVVKKFKPASTDAHVLKQGKILFDREAKNLEKLGNHDQIPRLLAHFQDNQQFYLVQEFIEGENLDQELTPGKKLSEAEVISILQDVLQVLEFVHQNNVIHRDIKPSNLIRRKQDGKLVLIDFGAVKQISEILMDSGIAGVNTAIGSTGYAPPEQMAGRPFLSSDIYAVGMIGIQALTGKSPGELFSVFDGEFTWEEYASVNEELAAILDKMVLYNSKERYQSAREVLQALKDIDKTGTSKIKSVSNTSPPSASQPDMLSGIKSFFKRFKS